MNATETTYDYTDEHGRLRFQVVRQINPKRFWQRRPLGSDEDAELLQKAGIHVAGGWVHSFDGVDANGGRRQVVSYVLYRLSELRAADPDTTVYVCEGERDVETLRASGMIATTNPGGAGKWQREYNAALRGRTVVVLQDNDDAGRRHAHDVATSLLGVAKSVVVLRLPGLPEGGDVSDWLAGEGTIEGLRQHAATAPAWSGIEPAPPRQLRFRIVSEREAREEPELDYLIDGALPAGAIALLHAPSESGKTLVALDIAMSVATGSQWQGRGVDQGCVVYIWAEGQSGRRQRVAAWKQRHGIGQDSDVPIHFVDEPVDPTKVEMVDDLAEDLLALGVRPRLLILDTWAACLASGGGDEDRATDVGRAVNNLSRIAHQFAGTTILIVHHEGHKQGGRPRPRGSSALTAACDTIMALQKSEQHQRITLQSTKQRDGERFPTIHLRLQVVSLPGDRTSCVVEPAPTPAGTSANRRGSKKTQTREIEALPIIIGLGGKVGSVAALAREWKRLRLDDAPSESTVRRYARELIAQRLVKGSNEGLEITPEGKTRGQEIASVEDGGQPVLHHQSPPSRGDGGGRAGDALTGEEKVDAGDPNEPLSAEPDRAGKSDT